VRLFKPYVKLNPNIYVAGYAEIRHLRKTQAFPEMPRQLRKFVIFIKEYFNFGKLHTTKIKTLKIKINLT